MKVLKFLKNVGLDLFETIRVILITPIALVDALFVDYLKNKWKEIK